MRAPNIAVKRDALQAGFAHSLSGSHLERSAGRRQVGNGPWLNGPLTDSWVVR